MKTVDKSYYNTVLSAAFSSCGKYLACGNVYGDIVIYKLSALSNHSVEFFEEGLSKAPKNKILLQASKTCHISSLISNDQFLIAGIGDQIVGWSWNDLINAESSNSCPKSAWNISIPKSSDNADTHADVNALKITQNAETNLSILYAGCGDNKVHSFSLEDGRLLRSYAGHTDYIHNIDIKDNVLVSGSEDGFIRTWDCRTSEMINLLEPHRQKDVCRNDLGPWIGDVSLNDDWLLCGGGVRLSLWNLRNLTFPMSVFKKTKDDGIHVAKFHQDQILAGGMAPYFSVLSYNNELHTKIESSSGTIYSYAVSSSQNSSAMLCIAGNGNLMDISANFKFREYVIPFY
ncbi:hypothetical protein V9T40_000299 [Parthenolecanium corni]|uniref:THO complex subunit 6 n=1 Tax=Parthenolecanium corni TaxID=536013 RepID=A0AAN9Y1G7_9HEMI